VGVAAVEAATGTDFNVLYDDFTRALVLSGTGASSDPKYNFTTLNLQTLQPAGRGGLRGGGPVVPPYACNYGMYAYSIGFIAWQGFFGTITLSGADAQGTAFGLSR